MFNNLLETNIYVVIFQHINIFNIPKIYEIGAGLLLFHLLLTNTI